MDDDSARSGPPIPPTQRARGNEVLCGEKRRRMPVQEPLDVAEMNQLSTDTRWVPYDASEPVSSSGRPAQRYSLLYQSCSGEGGLDFALLQKSSLHCLETLRKDMYARLDILRFENKDDLYHRSL